MSYGGEIKTIGKLTSIPTTFMFTSKPSSEHKWVKNTHNWVLGARDKHMRRQLSGCGRYAPQLKRSAAISPSSMFLSYGKASKLPKMSISSGKKNVFLDYLFLIFLNF